MANYRPFNFSWVVDGLLCAHGYPHSRSHFEYLYKKGIRTLVTLTDSSFEIDKKVAARATNNGYLNVF